MMDGEHGWVYFDLEEISVDGSLGAWHRGMVTDTHKTMNFNLQNIFFMV